MMKDLRYGVIRKVQQVEKKRFSEEELLNLALQPKRDEGKRLIDEFKK